MFPLLAGLLPLIGSGLAGFAGAKLAGMGSSGSSNASPRNSTNSKTLPSSGNAWSGYNAQIHQLPRFSSEQIKGLDQLRSMGLGGLQNNNQSFEPIAQQARENFSQKTIPSIAERFTAAGNGAQRSSAFGQSLGQGGSDLETNLAALGSQYNQNQQGHYKSLLGLGLQPQFDTKIEAAAPGLAQTLPGNLAQSLPSLLLLLSQLGYLGGK